MKDESFTETDLHWMREALRLAQQGAYTVRGNPLVGCVLVKDGQKIGEGAHWQRGQAHAEVNAIASASSSIEGATCYVTLEPCCHHGLTGPCVSALIEAGIQEVIVAIEDPNPVVGGKGINALRHAGIVVRVGLLAAEAKAINRGFFSRFQRNRPYVRAKLAISLDAKVAMASGESQWITGPEARQDSHDYRARSGAIITTAQTVLTDNCRLTPRGLTVPFAPPLRVVIDSCGRLTGQEALFQEPGEILVAVLDSAFSGAPYQRAFAQNAQHVDMMAVLGYLAEQAINDVWVEAGPTFLGAMLQQGCIDEWIIYQAPKWLGHEGLPMVYLPGLTQLSDHIAGQFTDVTRIGSDVRMTIELTRGVDNGTVSN